jgi:hypothetical protein
MNWKQLKEIADKDSIKTVLKGNQNIVNVSFTYKGAIVTALYSVDLKGLYGFELQSPIDFFESIA